MGCAHPSIAAISLFVPAVGPLAPRGVHEPQSGPLRAGSEQGKLGDMRAMLAFLALVVAPPAYYSQPAVCGRSCESDVQCPDSRGVCTYCMGKQVGGRNGPCETGQRDCQCQTDGSSRCGSGGGAPTAANSSKAQLLVIGDSISIGWSPVLFPMLTQFECQHVPTNAGPAAKGFSCAAAWLGNVNWDVVLFNFGLHSLDRHRQPDGRSAIVTGEAVSPHTPQQEIVCAQAAKLLALADTGDSSKLHRRADIYCYPAKTTLQARDLG